MTTREQDPLDDPFGDYEPTVSFALVAAEQAAERARLARTLIESHLNQNPSAENVIAASARKSAVVSLDRLASLAASAHAEVENARVNSDQAAHVSAAIEFFNESTRVYEEVQQIASALLSADQPPTPYVDPPLPSTSSWHDVVNKTKSDTFAWITQNRGNRGKMLVLKPSPSAGKTETMIEAALAEQKQKQRVVMAARTKDVLENELVPRIQRKSMLVKLHVIQGRNQDTCLNFENVKVVQEHGYAPGRSVCFSCEHHPRNAFTAQVRICDYYLTRMRAQNDSAAARRGLGDYPLICTTHSGFVTAQESGGGMYGKFWPHNLLLIDEDPTDSLEPELHLSQSHVEYSSTRPIDQAANNMAAILRAAMSLAATERNASAATKHRDITGKPSAIHSPLGSVYAGRQLHDLLMRVVGGSVGQRHGVTSLVQLLRDVSDAQVQPGVGELFGANTPEAASLTVPPRGLSRIGEVLYDEISAVARAKRLVYKKVHGRELPVHGRPEEAERELDRRVEMFDTSYRARLEFSRGEWRYVVQEFSTIGTGECNVVVGDAYAHIEHYRQLFDMPATKKNDPAWKDPVTVVSHTARFPAKTMLLRYETQANITWLSGEGWQIHAAKLSEIFSNLSGKRVLIYGHRALKDRIESLMIGNDSFGITEWAFEHWWGGRGKDHYRSFDAVVCISEPIQNIDGMLHKVNARSNREAARLFALGDEDHGLDALKRIRFDLKKHTNLANSMRADGTNWRIRQEHERQNINELAQALHRVRGLISPKTMVVLGQEIELTRDTIAACVPTSGYDSPLLQVTHPCLVTCEEAFTAILAIEERFGSWSPAFLHAFFGFELEILLRIQSEEIFTPQGGGYPSSQGVELVDEIEKKGGISGRAITDLYRIARPLIPPLFPNRPTISDGSSDGYPPPWGVNMQPGWKGSQSHPSRVNFMPGDHQGSPQMLGDHQGEWGGDPTEPAPGHSSTEVVPWWSTTEGVPPTLIQRVWNPGPRWQLVNELVRDRRARRLAEARDRAAKEFAYTGYYRPTWWGKQPGRGYAWYSNRSYTSGLKSFQEIIEDQYGPMVDGKLYAPRRKSLVPF